MPKEDFSCQCGQTFPDLPALQAHWEDPERDRTRPHYRALREEDREHLELERRFPPMHKDGPQ